MKFLALDSPDCHGTYDSDCGTWRIHHRPKGFGGYIATIYRKGQAWEYVTEIVGESALQGAMDYCGGRVPELHLVGMNGGER